MNRKKKICIVIIIVLTFVILGNLLLFFTKKDIKVAKNQENQLQDENIATENSINNVIDENTITQNEISENTAITETQDTVANSNVNDTKKVTVESTPKVAQNSKSQVAVVPKKETVTETQVAEKQETQENKQEEPKEESSSQVSQTNVEKYVRNDSMISRIKQVIQNNETQDMKRIRIFISSVQSEFTEERAMLCHYIRTDALLGKFFEPFIFEEVPANELPASHVYLKEVELCDIYLGLYGNMYGYEDETGTEDIINKCRDYGLKTPEFHQEEDFKVIIWRAAESQDVPKAIQDDPKELANL